MTPQQIIEKHYAPACDRIWSEVAAGLIDTDQAIERQHSLWLRVAARIKRETGYSA
jgi:hypothetical protein